MKKKIISTILLIVIIFVSYFLTKEIMNLYAEQNLVGESDNLSVDFLNVGMGDCTFIQYKDVQILIDSGECSSNAPNGLMGSLQIIQYIKDSMSSNDKTLDYIIVSHGDSDHLGNMAEILDGLDNDNYYVKNIIDFDSLYYDAFYTARYQPNSYEEKKDFFDSYANIRAVTSTSESNEIVEDDKYSRVLEDYRAARNKLVEKNTKYYCVTDRTDDSVKYNKIFENKKLKANILNSSSIFKLGLGLDEPVLRILYNKNYFDLLDSYSMNKKVKTDYAYYVNTKSVCSLITYGTSKILLTGDLEETHNMKGETNLLETYNYADPELLKDVTLYKAAHHGSSTSNSNDFIKKINPKYIAISVLANSEGNRSSGKWSFPRLDVMETFVSITNNIYITSYYNTRTKENDSYYGNVKFIVDENSDVEVKSSVDKVNKEYNNIYKAGKLVDVTKTDWYKDNRSLNVYFFDGYYDGGLKFGNCTLVKYGHYEILIDCGSHEQSINLKENPYVNKIKKYCSDNILEYVIITSPTYDSFLYMIDSGERKGILSEFKVGTIIDFGNVNPTENAENSVLKAYNAAIANYKSTDNSKINKINAKVANGIKITDNLSINILKNEYYGTEKNHNNDIAVTINYYNNNILLTNGLWNTGINSVIENNRLDNIVLYKASYYGAASAYNAKLLQLLSKTNSIVVVDTILGSEECKCGNAVLLNKNYCDNLIKVSKNQTYVTTEKINNDCRELSGDINFRLILENENKKINIIKDIQASTNNLVKLEDTEYYKNISN